jgi:hypothetical protein
MFKAVAPLLAAALLGVAAAPALAGEQPLVPKQRGAELTASGKPLKRLACDRRGKVAATPKQRRNSRRVPCRQSRTTATAAWYDNYGNWHNEGSVAFVRRWPTSGYYTGSGRYYYMKQFTLTWPFNIATLYEYYYWTGSAWKWWGDYQCTGMNLLPSDTCSWFPAR